MLNEHYLEADKTIFVARDFVVVILASCHPTLDEGVPFSS
jgi:hypothetical protein